MEHFRNIGIIGRLGSSQVLDTVRRLKKFLLERHMHVILEDTIAEVLPGHGLQTSSRKMLGEVCDMVIVVGGDGSLLGDNTDGAGLVRDLTVNAGLDLHGKRILLLGAGGAVRGVLEPLLAQRPAALVIANRTVEKAEQLAHEFADLGPVAASGFDWLDAPVDLIINGTSASLAGDVPAIAPSLIERGHTHCYDMMYGREATAFNRWAAAHGAAQTLDGLGMLVEQAAEAFCLWRQVRPDSAPVLAELRRLLAAA